MYVLNWFQANPIGVYMFTADQVQGLKVLESNLK